MWQDERRRIVIRNIVMGLLCAALIGGLVFFLIKNYREEEAASLKMEEEFPKSSIDPFEGREGTFGAKHMSVEDIEAEYQKDMDTVAQYLPGIVCWGDTFTAGSAGTVSFPEILQRYINTYICDIYDFKKSVTISGDLSRVDWDEYKVKIPVVNMGVDGEDTNTILGRSGVVPYVLKSEVTIPADTEPVEIEIISQNGKKVSPLTGGNGGVNNVTIDGIEGTLTLETNVTVGNVKKNQYYFTRTSAGEEYEAAAQTPIVTAASDMYKNYIHIIWMGASSGYKDEKELVSQIKELLARQTNNTDRYLVLGLCCRKDWGNFSSYDTAMTQAFGEHFINIRKYLCSDGLADAGIYPSVQDDNNTSLGIVPPRLRGSKGNMGLSAIGYRLVGKVVYDRMEQMGYFDEVVDELYINEVKKELLQMNPLFFSALIENW